MLEEKVWIFQLWIRKVSPHCRHTSLFYALCVCWQGCGGLQGRLFRSSFAFLSGEERSRKCLVIKE